MIRRQLACALVGYARQLTATVIAVLALVSIVGAAPALAQNAYITNAGDGTVSVIDTATDTAIGSPISVGNSPGGVSVAPDGSTVYVANHGDGTVSAIDTASNTVIATIPVGLSPEGVAITPDGGKVYVANNADSTVSVIDTATDMVIGSPIPVGYSPHGVAVTPDGSTVYVVNSRRTQFMDGTVSVIDTASNTVIATILVGVERRANPFGVAVTPDGSTVYITTTGFGGVAVIDTATNTVIATITVGGPGTSLEGVAVTPDGSTVYITNVHDGTVVVIDTTTNTVIGSPIPFGLSAEGVAITPDGGKVYVANNASSTVSVIDTASNTVSATIPVGNQPTAFGKFVGPAPAVQLTSGDHCDGVFTGSFDGNIKVSAGQSCVFVRPCEIERSVTLDGGTFKLACTVEGNIIQDNGNLILRQQAWVHGTVQISGTSAFTLSPGAAIRGGLHIRNLAAGLPLGTVCGVKVGRNLLIKNNASSVEIGGPNGQTCAGNEITRDLWADNNSDALLIDYNKIGGDLQVNSNSGKTDVSGNTVGDDMQCRGNASVTHVALNTVRGRARGQCAAFSGQGDQDDDGK
jgi:YVTN family beta-propeller protein